MGTHGKRGLVGQVLNDTYRIERMLGEGSMGAVYEASHLRLPRRFAIKVISPGVASNPRALARFRREAQITSGLGHPNIVEVVDFNATPGGRPYIVMELLAGEDFGTRMNRQPSLTVAEIEEFVRQIAAGLGVVHRQGIVHRDLKPSNLHLCPRGDRIELKILDFGISKVIGSQTQLTAAHSLVGTPYYMAPEQVKGDPESVGPRADVYATAAIVYEALAGRPPFDDPQIFQVLFKVLHSEPQPLLSRRPDVGQAISDVVMRSLSKVPAERFETIEQFAAAFSQACVASERLTRRAKALGTPPKTARLATTARDGASDDADPVAAPVTWKRRVLPPLLLLLVALGLIAIGLQLKGEDRNGATPTRVATPHATPHDAGPALATTASPDASPPDLGTRESAAQRPTAVVAARSDASPAGRSPASRARARWRARVAASRARRRAQTARAVKSAASKRTPAATPRSPGRLTLLTQLDGKLYQAPVYIDGKRSGSSPIFARPLSPGTHRIEVLHANYAPIRRTVTVSPNKTSKLIVHLKKR